MKFLRRVSVACVALLLVGMCFSVGALAAGKPQTPKISGIVLQSACSATVKWSKGSGVNGYEVYRATSKSGKYTKVKSTASTSFTNAKLAAGKTYYYRVRAYKKTSGKTVYSAYSSVKSIKMQLRQVKLAANTTAATASLTWGKIPGASGYQVYRGATKGGAYAKIASPRTASFTNSNLAAGRTYYYKVRAFSKVSGKTYYGAFSAIQAVTAATAEKKEPTIEFRARNPITESIKSDMGFFVGSRINFDLIVHDAAGKTSITIEEVAGGNPNGGNSKEFKQTRVIPIYGPGTYRLSQEMRKVNTANNQYSKFEYTVSACGEKYTVNYSGYGSDYFAGSWSHEFALK